MWLASGMPVEILNIDSFLKQNNNKIYAIKDLCVNSLIEKGDESEILIENGRESPR